MPIFVSCHCAETSLVHRRDPGRVLVSVDFSESLGLETQCSLQVPTSPVFSYYYNWAFEGSLRHLIITVARSDIAVSATVQLL